MAEAVRQITAEDAGCWLDGAYGWHNTYRVIDRAIEYGWLSDDAPALAEVREISARYEDSASHSDPGLCEVAGECADEATEYLQSIAPEGYSFQWDDGLVLAADDEWLYA